MDIPAIGLTQTSQSAPQHELRGSAAARKPEAQQQPVQKKQEPTPQQLQQALQTINRQLANSTSLEFSFDEGSKQTVVKVMDKDSGEVIRQIPSEAALAIAESIGEFQKGLLLRQEV